VVIVDERGGSAGIEGAKRRLAALRNRGCDADLGHLDFGDYAIAGNGPDGETVMIGVELKTTKDILNSLRSNRLVGHQVPGMVQMYEGRAWLLTEGIWRESKCGDWEVYLGSWQTFSAGNRTIKMTDIESWILSTVTFGGLMYWHAALPADTARFIRDLDHLWCDKQYDEHKTYDVVYRKPPDRVSFTEPSDFVKMVSCIDKVGYEKARALEGHFGGDFDALMSATAKDLQSVDGIGKTIAENVLRTLHPRRQK
jgi:ERCC4-type nuclease